MNFSVSPIRQQIESGMPVINGYSPLFFHEPSDWQKNIHTIGNWFIDKEPNFVPPTDLIHFIEKGEQPIYIGFGSMKDINSFKATLNIIQEALEITKQRAVVGLGWSKLSFSEKIPDNIFLIESIPHTWLFPKMKTVIHHDSAGTTATGLRAGKATIIIPHNADQPTCGLRVYELGVDSKPIKKNELNCVQISRCYFVCTTRKYYCKRRQTWTSIAQRKWRGECRKNHQWLSSDQQKRQPLKSV